MALFLVLPPHPRAAQLVPGAAHLWSGGGGPGLKMGGLYLGMSVGTDATSGGGQQGPSRGQGVGVGVGGGGSGQS